LISHAYRTWIWPKPSKSGRFLGYMRVGQSVRLRAAETVPGSGCAGGYYAIEPRGYICNDRTVTRSWSDFLRANAHTEPSAGAFPYRYALSNGAPMYARLPSAKEQKSERWRYGVAGKHRPLGMFQRGHEQLAETRAIAATDALPVFLAGGLSARGAAHTGLRRTIPHGSMFSFTRAFDVEGRTFLLSTDLTVVPADRVRPFRPSRFHGVKLGGELRLPIAYVRSKARPVYRLEPGGSVRPTGEQFPLRSVVALGADSVEHGGQRYLALRGSDGRFIAERDATVIERREREPFGVRPGDKYIIASISQGTLVAYRGRHPVFATLMSPGQGGVPRRGGDHVRDSTTPLGAYRITFKDRATTMSPETGENRSFWIADVPHTQYFNPPFALHGAYWHESFGEPMSAGCVNVSPEDAKWLFDWTDPQVPDGWQGATGAGAPQNGGATVVVITR
jgi:hypothetical protein